ncbi:MAG: type I DNA topoisomerase [Saprospiraceae bacterium]|nr:type I DNA topoisomerase [Saprospiraceae bacterium]
MSKNLLIVESPAKAKTIEKYLGKEFKVKSSYGHIRDLAKGDQGINIEKDFEPTYVVSPEKTKVVKELKDAAKKAEVVWLATDEDREGEAISWHLCEVLGLDALTTNRIVFREITKPAITKAVEDPRTVDLDLVNAQQARRILDRLVGFELSGVLWRKVRGKLSAGRVQSVAVKLIVEKEREIMKHIAQSFYKVSAVFTVKNSTGNNVELKAEYSPRFDKEEDARSFLEDCRNASFKISDIIKKPTKKKPAAPFTTSTLQQEASRKLGFSVNRTMQNAQRLYEAGSITYMRTDSTALSNQALGMIGENIVKEFGEKYHQVRQFKSKSENAQEAHEAIRPTYIEAKEVTSDRDQQRLYELIWKRTIASQMAEAQIEKTTAKISISTRPGDVLNATGEVLTFDGFLKVYLESKDDDEEEGEAKGMLPPLNIGQELPLNNMVGVERFTRPPSRYTEASLVKKLEELGIGRPSTYAPTITKIMEKDRGYVVKESREGKERKFNHLQLADNEITETIKTEVTGTTSNRLYATDMGMLVVDFLSEHFSEIMNYNFTANVENRLDSVARGKEEWKALLKSFYEPFHKDVEDTKENAERASGERILGTDPESGRTVLVRMAKFGPVAQIGTPDELGEGEKSKFGNLKPGQSMETITFNEAMDLFQLPKSLGEYKDMEVIVARGRFGPYIKFGEKFVNIPRNEDPIELKMDRAIELIEIKIKEDAPVGSYKGIPYTKGKGRFGPFLKYDKLFVNVPARYDFENLSQEDAHQLIEAKIQKEANRYIHQWPEDKLAVENGRWGPFIRFGKKSIKLPRVDKKAMSQEDAAKLTLEEVKKLVEAEIPDAFKKKTRAKAKPKAKAKTKAKPKTKK